MTNKNFKILLLFVLAVGFQACGDSVKEGFSETSIDILHSDLTPGIREGICEKTNDGIIFKSGDSYTYILKSESEIKGPDGEEYIDIDEQDQNADVFLCVMKVDDNHKVTIKVPESSTWSPDSRSPC